MAAIWGTVISILLFEFSGATQDRTVYDFESEAHLNDFSVSGTSTLELSGERYKDGSKSMKWPWASGDSITHSFTSNVITGNELSGGGIKLWIYSPHYSSLSRTLCLNLTVSFQDTLTTPGTPIIISRFNISLSFKGWRAIWVSYKEALVAASLDDIDTMKITAPTTALPAHPLYFDLVRLVNKVSRQSRDKIVPPFGDGLYTPTNFWQQTYRWSQVTPTAVSSAAPDAAKLADLSLIEKRIDNWFVSQAQSSTTFTGNAQKRWESLLGNIDTANVNYGTLNIEKSDAGVITGKSLYARDSDYDDKKFNFATEGTLLPLTLGYHIMSRTVEVDAVAAQELPNLNNEDTKAAAVAKIAGADEGLQTTFTDTLGTAPYTLEKVKEAIGTLNDKRKDRLLLLLDYIKDQGFTDGSAIGSLDHIMNTNGAGFCNSVYLLRDVLGATRLAAVLNTMKWYSDFGEIYQDTFEYTGTTTDRMRTIALYRLYAILMMPNTTVDEQKRALRDMEALGRWYENALTPNEGLGGVLKPDYIGFHHNGYYASAYYPQALHMAAYIEYLLSGTSYAFGQVTSDNIKKGLEVTRIVSVKYSSPNSVCGRFPGFSRAILAKCFPAYAYHGATAPVLNDDGSLGPITTLNADKIKMFLRLYDTTDTADTAVTEYLEDGTISSGIFYLNSIGSINIMEAIAAKATALSISAESSPKGFWSKNYAALVVYRREDWAVSMKGFNKFVWDFESSNRNNVFGLYQSHGALLVANSEAALKTMDMDKGWDWTRHPGTTTIKMDLGQLISDNRRYLQPKELAGGLVLYGGGDYPTGIFGMEFSQPSYRYKGGSFQLDIGFEFKKSVFFAGNAVICLGSDIEASNSSPNITQTTLFQNKRMDKRNPSSIYIGSTSHSLNTDFTASDFTADTSVTLMDVNGNGYYIPNAQAQGLTVEIGEQTSKKNNNKPDPTTGRYATVYLNHGVNPTNKEHEFAILVNKPNSDILDLQTSQDGSAANKVYEVLHKDDTAHVVKINNSPRAGETQTGYVFFHVSARPPGGLVRRVNKAPCIVMVEEVDDKNLYIAVSSPNLNFNITNTIEVADEVTGDERFYSYSLPVDIQVSLSGDPVNVATGDVKQDGTLIPAADKTDYVEVIPSSNGAATGRKIKFKNLVKGFSTEVKLTRP